jgi:hypothetical protein
MEIKKVSMAIKEQIAEDSANSYFTYNKDGELIGYSEIDKMKTLIYRLFEYYTDIEIPTVVMEENETKEDFILKAHENEAKFIDDVINDYDFYGIDFDELCLKIPNDYNLILNEIETKVEFKKKKIEDDNSFSKMILKLLQSFLEKAPDSKQMQEIMENFKDMDLNKLGDVMEIKKMLNV